MAGEIVVTPGIPPSGVRVDRYPDVPVARPASTRVHARLVGRIADMPVSMRARLSRCAGVPVVRCPGVLGVPRGVPDWRDHDRAVCRVCRAVCRSTSAPDYPQTRCAMRDPPFKLYVLGSRPLPPLHT